MKIRSSLAVALVIRLSLFISAVQDVSQGSLWLDILGSVLIASLLSILGGDLQAWIRQRERRSRARTRAALRRRRIS